MQLLFLMDKDDELPWLSYRPFGNLVGNLTELIVKEQNWQPMIDVVWNNRQVNDCSGKNVNKRDFMRSWTHSRTAQHISIEEVLETGVKLDGERLFEIAEPRGKFESQVLSELHMEQFKSRLREQDKQILQMWYEGYSLKEIAIQVGFKTPCAVG